MANHFDKRLDPRILVPGAKSVVSLLLNYHSDLRQEDPEAPKISQYAFGEDYHHVIKKKLKAFMAFIQEEIGEVGGRVFVDSAPVMDKAWAAKSGLGWVGKNTNLISKKRGSFFFIAELILDLELEYDLPATDHCGNCTACIDACPTEALIAPYQIDGSKCISYLTIELKDQIPSEFQGKMDQWAFGCDVCQTVCPWNRFSTTHEEPAFMPQESLLSMTKNDWQEMTEEVFDVLFKNSAVKRTKYKGLKRNLAFLKGSKD
jgi:epoxyqueuosine reductase